MTEDEALKAAYLAGFNASGEGYNGEYPFHGAHPEQDAGWIKNRDNEITAIKQARSAPVQKPVATGDTLFRQFMSEAEKAGVTHWPTPPAQPATEESSVVQPAPVQAADIAALVEGMEVSIDVSTGDHDSGNRLFGTVTLAQENQGSKHGLILLVQDPEANFKATDQPPAQPAPVQPVGTYGEIHESMQALLRSGLQRDQQIYIEMKDKPLYTTPPAAQRQWVGLTDDQIRGLTPKPDGVAEGNVRRVEVLPGVMGTEFDEVDAWSMPLVLQIARAIEAKLRSKNNG